MSYKNKLSNIDATARTIKNVQSVHLSPVGVVVLVLLVAGVVWVIYRLVSLFKNSTVVQGVSTAVTAPAAAIVATDSAARAEEYTGQNSELDQGIIEQKVDTLLDQLDHWALYTNSEGYMIHRERHTGVQQVIMSLTSAADWVRLCEAFYNRDKGCNNWAHPKKRSLPGSLTYHLYSDELTKLRKYLQSIGVRDPGF